MKQNFGKTKQNLSKNPRILGKPPWELPIYLENPNPRIPGIIWDNLGFFFPFISCLFPSQFSLLFSIPPAKIPFSSFGKNKKKKGNKSRESSSRIFFFSWELQNNFFWVGVTKSSLCFPGSWPGPKIPRILHFLTLKIPFFSFFFTFLTLKFQFPSFFPSAFPGKSPKSWKNPNPVPDFGNFPKLPAVPEPF